VVIVVYAAAGWDPLVHLFFLAGTGGGYGILLLTTLTAVAVIAYFHRHRRQDNLWRRAIAPVLSAAGLAAVTWLATDHFDTLLGVAPNAPVRTAIPAAYAAAMLAGAGWALILRRTRPHVYARIGLGAKAATTALTATIPGPRPATHASNEARR
jgi:hypothetical protein